MYEEYTCICSVVQTELILSDLTCRFRGLNTHSRFLGIFKYGDNFCNFLIFAETQIRDLGFLRDRDIFAVKIFT